MTNTTEYVYRDGAGTCATCGGRCDKRAKRCRPCTRTAPFLVCPRCKRTVAREEMTNPSGRMRSYCGPCTTEWFREHRWLYKYGITAAQYEQMLAEQGGKCAICETEEEGRGYEWLHVDHDHGTGQVRGLLCFLCNSGIGKFKDNPGWLRRAAEYVEMGDGDCGDGATVEP